MELVTSIVNPVVESLMIPIKKHLGYLVFSSSHIRSMCLRMKQLDDIGVDIKDRMERHNINNLDVPRHVPGWLEEVETIKEQTERISTEGNKCYNVVTRYKAGRKAFKIIQEIDRLIREESETNWTNLQKPLGKFDSRKPSASISGCGSTQNDIESRYLIFKDALKSLQPGNEIQRIALCGMGGVGKTTMMEQLKKAVEDAKMFDYIAKADLGENTDPLTFQQAIAEYTGQALTEKTKSARADRLRKRFEKISEDGQKKVLIILDDIWQAVNLRDIGLAGNLPNGYKLLLTSRFKHVCTQMGVEPNSIFAVPVLKYPEAQDFFFKVAGILDSSDPELHNIGEAIVMKCGGLPLAIKTIASYLRDNSIDAWKDALTRLVHNDLQDLDDILHKIVELSYASLKKDEEKAIFLLCGLFPDDFDIPIEELMRYGWGLKLFAKVYTIDEARDRTNASVGKLISANMLTKSDYDGCVKMHDLIRAFVLTNFSKVKQASIVNPRNMSEWPTQDTRESCERIHLICNDMSEFPRDFTYPNLTFLKLMHGDMLFPEDFYERMGKLEVVAYEMMHDPLLPVSLQYSTKLRTLTLYSCSLMISDLSLLGNLINLEILSFAYCQIQMLPSTIGKLSKLKLLDLTGCNDLFIDDGAFQNLVSLEELYMGFSYLKVTKFTDANCDELEKLSGNLFALRIEFFNNNVQPKNMSFKNLKRFNISIGCHLLSDERNQKYSSRNTLDLVTNRNELLECKINELFVKTEKLYFQVNDMNSLDDISTVSSHHHGHLFYSLKVLHVHKCEDLKYLFSVPVANGLVKLEKLTVSFCPILEVLVHDNGNGNGDPVEVVTFQKLKFLLLNELPNLVSLCDIINVIKLPELVELILDGLSNFTSVYPWIENAVPKLEKLMINSMNNLNDLWPCQISSSQEANVSMLKEITVKNCNNLVNLFPSNPLPLLQHLKYLYVDNCGSIEVLFNMDFGCVGGNEKGSSKLRRISVQNLEKLEEIWRIKGVTNFHFIDSFQAVEYIYINRCKSFRNVVTPTTMNFDLRALTNFTIDGGENLIESWTGNEWVEDNELVESSQKINGISKEEIVEVDDSTTIAFPYYLLLTLHHLRKLDMQSINKVEVVFEMESESSKELVTTQNNQQSLLLPNLRDLELHQMNGMSHVWKCNWSKLLITQQHQEYTFLNLTNIHLSNCHNIKYLFSPLVAKNLSNLKKVIIRYSSGIEEVVSNRDDGDENFVTSTSSHAYTTFFPRLYTIYLHGLHNLKHVGGGWARIGSNDVASNSITQSQFATWSLCQYPREITISHCNALSRVITLCAIGHMQKLEVLEISSCHSIMEIFQTQRIDDSSASGTGSTVVRLKNIVVHELPNLTILHIFSCHRLRHVFTFSTFESLKQLKVLKVESCKAMKVIVKEENGEHATASKFMGFNRLETLELINLPNLKGFLFQRTFMESGDNVFRVKNVVVLKLVNLKLLRIIKCDLLRRIFSFSTLESLMNLQELTIKKCKGLEAIVKEDGGQTMASKDVVFHLLESITLVNLSKLKGFFLGMNDFSWPILDKIKIHNCPKMSIFTCGQLTTPKLNFIHTSFGKYSLERDLNYHVATFLHQTPFGTSSYTTTSEEIPSLFSIWIDMCVAENDEITKIIPFQELTHMQKLEKILVKSCSFLEVVFETQEETNNGLNDAVKFPKLKVVDLLNLDSLKYLWKSNRWTVLEFPNLTRVSIVGCNRLEHVFTCSMVGSLLQLEEIHLSECDNIETIVKKTNAVVQEEEEVDAKVNEITLPCLKWLKLEKLPSLQEFCSRKESFLLPSLDTLKIIECPDIAVFTHGHLATPQLQAIHTSFGVFAEIPDPNFFIKTKRQEGFEF